MNHRNSRIRLAALLLSAGLGLSACSSGAPRASEGTASVALPEPPVQETRQLLGDTAEMQEIELPLYCATDGSLELTAITRNIRAERGEPLLRAALLELLNTAPGSSALLVGSAESQLADVEFGGGVATVRLSLDSGANRSDQDYLLLCASIANTLLEVKGVNAVNILCGERSNSVCGLPSGAYVAQDENVAASYAKLQAERERFEGNGSTITRNALLYFPASNGDYLLPEVREISFSANDIIETLLSALQFGPQERECCFTAMAENLDLLATAPLMSITDAGERVAEISLSDTVASYLALAGVEPWQLYGSMALTLCSFMPELDAVRLSIEGVYVTECELGGRRLQFNDGLMRRADFSASIGSSAALYFAKEDGGLARVECATSQAGAFSPSGILAAMIENESAPAAGLHSIFPDGIFPEDILGVAVESHIATINLSSNFYSRCQAIDAAQERTLIYGMVNALTELEGVGAVAFLVEGNAVDGLSQNIYLRMPLLPDHGLVR